MIATQWGVLYDAEPDVVVEIHGALLAYMATPPTQTGGEIRSHNDFPMVIRPYGIVVAPRGTYRVSGTLILPLFFARLPDPAADLHTDRQLEETTQCALA